MSTRPNDGDTVLGIQPNAGSEANTSNVEADKISVPVEQSASTTDQAVVQPNPLPSVIKATFKIGDSIYSGDIQLTEGPGITVPQKEKTNLLRKINLFNKGGKTARRSRRARGRTIRKKRRN